MKKLIALMIASLFIGCLGSEEEDIQVKLNYDHKKQKEYPEANYNYRGGRRPVLVAKHEIDVRDFQEKYIYDKAILDENLTGTVNVPVNINLEVQYKNYSFEEPEIHYESGVSDPFKVLFNSAPTRTVTIPVAVNPDYPVEEDTTDNETEIVTVEETYILSWSDNFTFRTRATQTQEDTYKAFWDNASNYQWDNITIGNSDNTTTCDNSTIVNSIVDNFDNMSYTFRGLYCNGMYWTFGKCGWGNEIGAHDQVRSKCTCLKTENFNSYTVRPLIGNNNWGGVGKSCSANSQTLKVILGR